jgi:7-cyano-7-deazaguanine tRNA-ribosyltransferase
MSINTLYGGIYMEPVFEIKRKDAAARIGKLTVGGKIIETPCLMPVYNPRKPTLSIEELKAEFAPPALMANAYIFLKDEILKSKVLDEGIHRFLGFDGVIATDSGSYQLMVYGAVETTNKEIIGFQEEIGSDIGSFLDIPSPPDTFLPRAKEHLGTTLERAREAQTAKFAVNAAVQGAKYPELRFEAAKEIGSMFKLAAIGGIVPLMEAYRFSELVDVIAYSKQGMPSDTAVHAFGLGHPMIFPLACLLGCDLFDSAAYVLYAQDGRYLTDYGTKHVDELKNISCTCPICSEHGIGIQRLYGEDKVRALARHNLYVSYAMIERVKQAIEEGSLWELVLLQARSHPLLLSAVERLMQQSLWISKLDLITKPSAFYVSGAESSGRSEVLNARERLKRLKSQNTINLEPFGEVQEEVLDIYPFNGVYSMKDEPYPKVRDIYKLRAIMEYQFGEGAGELLPDNLIVKKSKNTKRIRWLYEGSQMIASVRASDHFIIPHEKLALRLKDKFEKPRLRVVMADDDEAIACVRDGKSVMCKFVKEVDPNLRCGDECIVVDKDDNLIRSATLHLSPTEIKDFKRGMAARTR